MATAPEKYNTTQDRATRKRNITIPKIAGHLRKILVLKAHVMRYCFLAGLYWQGLTHDLSKFSFTEFWESVRYYEGDRSPILACKEEKGYSLAWQHHKGRNRHHYEYWQDDFDHGGHPIQMPFRYALELICDYLGAGEAYNGQGFTFADKYDWWQKKLEKPVAMPPQTVMFVGEILGELARINDITVLKRDQAREIYNECSRKVRQD